MAKLRLFQMHDTNAGVVSGPILAAENPAPFVREFKRILADPQTEPGKYPEDFELREIGSQDTETGELVPIIPTIVYSGKQWAFDRTPTTPGESQRTPVHG